jgi:hypothetical protein
MTDPHCLAWQTVSQKFLVVIDKTPPELLLFFHAGY